MCVYVCTYLQQGILAYMSVSIKTLYIYIYIESL